jgi:hypothetical protein
VWLGGDTSLDDYANQVITVPAETTSLVISGYRYTLTQETLSGDYDDAYIDLWDSTFSTLKEELVTYSNNDTTTGWVSFSLTASTPYAGQTLTLSLNSSNDFSRKTSFYFDSLSVKATHCP